MKCGWAGLAVVLLLVLMLFVAGIRSRADGRGGKEGKAKTNTDGATEKGKFGCVVCRSEDPLPFTFPG